MEYPELDADVDFPESFPQVYADPDKLEQVLTNLIENACKYASATGLRVVGSVADGRAQPSPSPTAAKGSPPTDLPTCVRQVLPAG